MNNVKKNNKGFSLVELIVVVLIMAIIAVSLAPQVMKWVNNSRVATDVSNYDSLVANCQLALADANAFAAVKDTQYTLTYDEGGMKLTKGTGASAATIYDSSATTPVAVSTDAVLKALDALDPSWQSLRAKTTPTTDYQITINAGGTIGRTVAPSSTME